MNVDLLQRLMQSWGMMAERRFERSLRDGYVEIVLGLRDAHQALGGPPRTDPAPEHDEEQPGFSLEHDVTLEARVGAAWASTTQLHVDFEAYRCRVLDASSGGFRLEWRGNNRVKLKIGNLIAVRETGERAEASGWSLGLIRWMRAKHGDTVEFGIQSCASAAEPVLMRVCSAEGRCGDFVEGFLVPEAPELSRAAALIAPGFLEHLFRPKILISRRGREETCRLTRMLESTGVAALFEYVVEKRSGPVSTPGGTPAQDAGFDGLWENI